MEKPNDKHSSQLTLLYLQKQLYIKAAAGCANTRQPVHPTKKELNEHE